MSLQESIKSLLQGDWVTIFSKHIPEAKTQPLPESGTFEGLYFSQSDKYPKWIIIHQIRKEKKIAMAFPVENIQSITINQMTPQDIAKKLVAGQVINITTSFRNTSGQFKDYLGEFVSFETKGHTYILTIKVPTDFIGIAGKVHYEDKTFWGQCIQKITVY